MTPDMVDDPFGENAIEALRAHPGLRAACEADAAAGNALYLSLPAEARWFARDIGRYGLCVAAMLMDLMGVLTLQTLTFAAGHDISSPGRADRLVERALAIGAAVIEPGDGPRNQRPLHFGEPLVELVRARTRVAMMRSLPIVANPAELCAAVSDEALFSQFLMRASQITTERRDLFSFWSERPVDLFASREGGMLILQDLLLRQAPGRERLLEAAPLSRYRLARTYGLSRAHINNLLAESPFVETTDDRIVFDPAFSRDFGRYFITGILLGSAAARDVCGGWRYPAAA